MLLIVITINRDAVIAGINKYKLIIVTKPNDGANPSVSFSFASSYTTLAGMSSSGITG